VDATVLLLILIGVVCIVAAIVGGGFELPGIKVPPIQPGYLRVVLGSVGVVVIGGALLLPGLNSPKGPAPTGTSSANGTTSQDGWYNVRTAPRLVHPGIPNDLVVDQTPTAGAPWCPAAEVVIGVTK
jgi:hypothetical protein